MLRITLGKKYYVKRMSIGRGSTLHFWPKFSDFSVAHIAILCSLALAKDKNTRISFQLLQRSNPLLIFPPPSFLNKFYYIINQFYALRDYYRT